MLSVGNRPHSCFHLTHQTKGQIRINRYKRVCIRVGVDVVSRGWGHKRAATVAGGNFLVLVLLPSRLPLCAHGTLSHGEQKLIVSSLSPSTSLYSYPFVWPVFRFLWDIAAEQKTPVLGFRWCTVFTPPETFSLFPTRSGVCASSQKDLPGSLCVALLLDVYWLWSQRSRKSLIIFFYLLWLTQISVAQYWLLHCLNSCVEVPRIHTHTHTHLL